MSGLDLDMELERGREDFERRVEEGRREIRERIERLEQGCREAEDARRQDWEELKGRLMTAEEKRQHESDGFLRLIAAMTNEYVSIMRAFGADMERGFAEVQSEGRANREALFRLLDRLPPPGPEQ
ncbi:MAG TPA: hypothetical protein VGK41_03290 [Solirubrobacterales bacterium]